MVERAVADRERQLQFEFDGIFMEKLSGMLFIAALFSFKNRAARETYANERSDHPQTVVRVELFL